MQGQGPSQETDAYCTAEEALRLLSRSRNINCGPGGPDALAVATRRVQDAEAAVAQRNLQGRNAAGQIQGLTGMHSAEAARRIAAEAAHAAAAAELEATRQRLAAAEANTQRLAAEHAAEIARRTAEQQGSNAAAQAAAAEANRRLRAAIAAADSARASAGAAAGAATARATVAEAARAVAEAQLGENQRIAAEALAAAQETLNRAIQDAAAAAAAAAQATVEVARLRAEAAAAAAAADATNRDLAAALDAANAEKAAALAALAAALAAAAAGGGGAPGSGGSGSSTGPVRSVYNKASNAFDAKKEINDLKLGYGYLNQSDLTDHLDNYANVIISNLSGTRADKIAKLNEAISKLTTKQNAPSTKTGMERRVIKGIIYKLQQELARLQGLAAAPVALVARAENLNAGPPAAARPLGNSGRAGFGTFANAPLGVSRQDASVPPSASRVPPPAERAPMQSSATAATVRAGAGQPPAAPALRPGLNRMQALSEIDTTGYKSMSGDTSDAYVARTIARIYEARSTKADKLKELEKLITKLTDIQDIPLRNGTGGPIQRSFVREIIAKLRAELARVQAQGGGYRKSRKARVAKKVRDRDRASTRKQH